MTDGRIQRERDAMSAAASRCEVNGRTDGRKKTASEREAGAVSGGKTGCVGVAGNDV